MESTKALLDRYQEMTVPIEEIVPQIQAGQPGIWHEGSDIAKELARDQEAVSQDVSAVLGGLESVWSGTAADMVSQRLRTVRSSMTSAQQTFHDNSGTHASAASMLDNLRNQMTPMSAEPLTNALKSGKNLFDSDVMTEMRDHNAASAKNLQLYQDFTHQTQANSGQLKYDYGKISAYDGGVTVHHSPSVPGPAHPPAGKSAPGGQWPGGSSPRTTGPAGQVPSVSGTSGQTPGVNGGRGPYSGNGNPGSYPHSPNPADATSTSSYLEPTGSGQSRFAPPAIAGYQPGAAGPNSGGSGLGYPSGIGFGSTGGGSEGATPPRGPGGGSRAGTGEFGPRGSGSAGTGAPRAGAAGERGMPGAGMSGGGRGGKKEDDAEHSRKYVLDTDDIFSGEEATVDPATGLRSTPPTLGA
ncbi:hypothetical protein G3I59_42535 [Amycolatopsis rubida]|uniref:PPE domain-containing protein n=1 Tax=Amycolatopsis rubida TaxID=112413 RepID=A0ABX0C307_9PSEU|nr:MULTISPECIES: hypothetical protein [Amycolatopsis]MYW97121.1 hypothetical protein [Amycolatopsis rubida]NEC62106.1 hypothetical protein [Amycolatopsis rubida]